MKKFLQNKKGVSTVEFALTVAFYFFVVCLILEFCRVTITAAYWDLAITESVRIAKNKSAEGNDYATEFEKALKQQIVYQENSTIGYLARLDKNGGYKIDVKYVDCDKGNPCIQALLDNKFREPKKDSEGRIVPPNGQLATLAVYSLTYNYDFLVSLPFLPKSGISEFLSRKIIAVQEFNRSKFQYSRKSNDS
ncbi:MAG: pilus assembly protein [Aggregatibacter aphrophilus]|jgi:tadE|uniref:TadE/TadG family type IV pilus assembly protein n=1 Tax=Aggregatibacter aphrophilus TaxID=732 RepID=UPI00290A060A|nr:pilus assembly protein [Aggregatibacter aphrophilus]MDU7785205.1 pilus assembly protein [Aggregatibacter aphrophilus]